MTPKRGRRVVDECNAQIAQAFKLPPSSDRLDESGAAIRAIVSARYWDAVRKTRKTKGATDDE